MKSIILANIGNRNLTYQSKTLLPDNRLTEPQPSFRERTLDLLTRYKEVKADLNEQILSVLIRDVSPENIEKVVLFASDNQIEGDRNDQDTIHEARILQRLFAEQMNLVVEVVEYTQNVTYNDELLRFYRNTLRPYQASDTPVVICDAGGTAQQKAALKIAAEYLLDPARFSVRYVLPSGKLTTVEQVEYRRIIDEEQVAALVEHGQYAGALAIYNKTTDSISLASQLLNVLLKRSELFWQDSRDAVNDELAALHPILFSFKKSIPLGSINQSSNIFDNQKLMALCERLEIASYRYAQKDWSRFVLSFSVFMEAFINTVIHKQSSFKLDGDYFSAATALQKEINETKNHEDIKAYFGGEVKTGIGLHLKYALKISSGEVQSVLTMFESLNSRTNGSKGARGLDRLRNDIAHKGRSVREGELNKEAPTAYSQLQSIRRRLGFPEENVYKTLNSVLINLLRQ